MTELLDMYAPHVFALLAGGLGTSLGAAFWARSARGSALLARWSGRAFAAGTAAIAFASAALGYLLVRSMVTAPASAVDLVTPGRMFLLGIAIGVPMGLPGVIAGRAEAIRRSTAREKKRDFVPTKDDRRAYAVSLAKQIAEVSPDRRTVTADITGSGGTTLRLDGPIDSTEGDRLTAALRADLKDVGFKRVEGGGTAKPWWSRV